MATTYDDRGIPRSWGADVFDVAFEQGRAVALDRTWQITRAHWRARGRTAAALGPAGLGWDRFARRAQVEETARAAYQRLDLSTKAFVGAYVDGVNAGLDVVGAVAELDGLGVRPEPWEPWVPLGIFWANHILFASFPGKLWRRHLVATAGPEVAALFAHEGLWSAGSNAWAVGGERTASGLPLIGGDPHRNYEAPNCYQQVHLVCPDFDVTGFTFPGVPGVQHFAHTGSVAWAITNASADYQDLYVESLRSAPDGVEALGPSGWYAATVTRSSIEVRGADPVPVETIVTRNGPVVVDGEEAFSLRTPVIALQDMGFAALVPLLHARSVADVEAAFRQWVEPVNNLLVADTGGEVLQQVVGRVPLRAEENRWLPVEADAEADWTGWVDVPRAEVPPDGQVVTCNQRMSGFDRIGVEFARPARADRIAALLDGRVGLTAGDFAAIHTDTLRPASELLDLVSRARPLSPDARAVVAELTAWDGRMDAGSTGGGRFLALRDAVISRLMALDSLAALGSRSPYGELYDAWFVLPSRILIGLDAVLGAGALLGYDAEVLVAQALEDVARMPGSPLGEAHRMDPWHALVGVDGVPPTAVPRPCLGGDVDCVLAVSTVPGRGAAYRGPVARYVWDLADRSSGGWVVPLGAAGDLAAPHGTDQVTAYAEGRLLPLPPLSRDRRPGG